MLINAPIPSPCKLICTLDISRGLCTGCGRTRDEITRWLQMSEAERELVMRRVKDHEPEAHPSK